MDGSSSPLRAVDILLERHRSSLRTGTVGAAAPAPAAASRPTTQYRTHDHEQHHEPVSRSGTGSVGAGGANGSAVSSAHLFAEGRDSGKRLGWHEREEGIEGEGVRGEALLPQHHAGVLRSHREPLCSAINQEQEKPEVDIVRRDEEVDLYGTLEFRLRTNDRDLQSILSRSTERLALSERQPPATPQLVAAMASHETTPSASAAPVSTPPQVVEPVRVPMLGTGGTADKTALVPPRDASVTEHSSSKTTPSSATEKCPEAASTAAIFSAEARSASLIPTNVAGDAGKLEDRQRQPLAPEYGTSSDATRSRTDPDNISGNGMEAAAAAMAAGEDPAVLTTAEDSASIGSDHPQRPPFDSTPSPGGAAPAPSTGGVSGPSGTGGSGIREAREAVAVTPQRPTRGKSGRSRHGGQSSGISAGLSSGDPPTRPPRGGVPGARSGRFSGGVTSTEADAEAERVRNTNNIEGILGTPPRLPRPVTEGMIVGAAKEAARWLAVDDRTWHQAKKFMDDCIADRPSERILARRKMTPSQWRESKVAAIEAALRADPSLATSRHINRSAFPMDGWTPLHAAAARGNLEFVKALLKVSGVSVWSLDLQGRTALALAAEGGHLDLCLLLKERMEAESADTIVGINAPVDLAGMTPLAWSVKSRSRNKQVESHLYAAGDASVCPATPAELRSGGAKTAKGGTARTGAGRAAAESVGDGLPCGYSEAPGWRIEMEDAICTHNPIPTNPEAREAPPADPTSMFGIFDGHGGSFTSKYVAGALVGCLQATPGWKSGDRDLSKLCPAISEAFVSCDALLAKEPRMVVTENPSSSDGKRFEARDGSGSTAVVAFVTAVHVIVANAGDSRAVLIMLDNPGTGSESGSGASKMENSETGSTENSEGGTRPCDSVRLEAAASPGQKDEEFEIDEGMDKILAALGAMGLREDTSKARRAGGGSDEGAVKGGSSVINPSGKRGRAVEVTAMSRDHTARDEREKERVTLAGGKAFEVKYRDEDGTESMVIRTAYDENVEGQSVMPTRGFGDMYYKQKKGTDGSLLPPAEQVVTVCPEIMVHERGSSGSEEILLLACDGVWDVFDNQDVGEFLVSQLERPIEDVDGEDLARACDALVDECLRRGSTDNITAMAVSLGSGPPPPPSTVGGRMLFGDGQ